MDMEKLLCIVFGIFSKIAMDTNQTNQLERLVSVLSNVKAKDSSELVLKVVRSCVTEMEIHYGLKFHKEQTEMTVAAAETDIEVDSEEFSSEAEVEDGRAERSFAEILYKGLFRLPSVAREELITLIKETKDIFSLTISSFLKMNDQDFFFWLVENYEKFYPKEATKKKKEWLAHMRDAEADPLVTADIFGRLFEKFALSNNLVPETPEFPNVDYYAEIGVTTTAANTKQIQRAYHKTVKRKKCHPDVFTNRLMNASTVDEKQKIQKEMDLNQEYFDSLTHIKDILSNPVTRHGHDLWLKLSDTERAIMLKSKRELLARADDW